MEYYSGSLIAPQGTGTTCDVVYVSHSDTHDNNDACDSSNASHDISNNENSSTCATTDNNISAFNSDTIKYSSNVATCNSDYTIHDANRGKD